MKYIVEINHYISGQGYQYTETVDSGITDKTFTAAEWNAGLDTPYADTDSSWEEITVKFYADDVDPAFDDPISTDTHNETIRGQF